MTEAAFLAAGYAPAVGFIDTGKPLFSVYDIADIYKFVTVVPVAIKVAASRPCLDESMRPGIEPDGLSQTFHCLQCADLQGQLSPAVTISRSAPHRWRCFFD